MLDDSNGESAHAPQADVEIGKWLLIALPVLAVLAFFPLLKAHFEYEWIDDDIHPYEKVEAAENLAEAYGFYGMDGEKERWQNHAALQYLIAKNRDRMSR